MQDIYQEFQNLDTTVIAISNEDTSLSALANTEARFPPSPKFRLLADLNRRDTKRLERTTAYFVDKQGVVRQIFPMEIYDRPAWWPIINEIERLVAG